MSFSSFVRAKSLSVVVTDIDTSRPGRILAMLFAEEGFPKVHDLAQHIQSRQADSETLEFEFMVSDERFAIKILHDENEDGKTSKNWTGIIPSEGLGFSNGAKLTLFGPPNFKTASLSLNDLDSPVTIAVRYP